MDSAEVTFKEDLTGMKEDNEHNTTMVSLRLPSNERNSVSIVAKANDRTFSQEVRRAIRFYLSRLQEANQELLQGDIVLL